MSASLVGSEMCIRDRSNADTNTTSSKSKHTSKKTQQQQQQKQHQQPVSYTHLTLPTICSV
eukprot:13215025-Alexandrium_andersonii.AAC.1